MSCELKTDFFLKMSSAFLSFWVLIVLCSLKIDKVMYMCSISRAFNEPRVQWAARSMSRAFNKPRVQWAARSISRRSISRVFNEPVFNEPAFNQPVFNQPGAFLVLFSMHVFFSPLELLPRPSKAFSRPFSFMLRFHDLLAIFKSFVCLFKSVTRKFHFLFVEEIVIQTS